MGPKIGDKFKFDDGADGEITNVSNLTVEVFGHRRYHLFRRCDMRCENGVWFVV